MACTLTINGRAFPCKDKIGGIKRVWMKIYDSATDDWGAITAGVVASTGTTGSVVFFGFEITKNSGSFQQAVNASMENGVIFYSQVLEMTMPNLIAADNVEVSDLLKNRLTIVVQDVNDNYFAMGHTQGVEATGGTIGTGTAKGDLNGYQLQFTAEEAIPAPFVASDDAGITFTAGT
tara:strand:- start:97 stop:627 length:531 start_codon:yes stop_codon:yes gene_type:complete